MPGVCMSARQRKAEDEVRVGRGQFGQDAEGAGVGFDDLAGEGEAEADAGVAGGEERFGGPGGGVGGEAGALVVEVEGEAG